MQTNFFLRLLQPVVFSLFLSWLTVATAQAADISPEKATPKLIEFLNGIQSMQASFEQWVMDAKQNALQNVTGEMWVQRPGQFRWDTAEPYPQTIVSDGSVLWIFDEDLEQATKKTLDRQVGNTPALLLSGDPAKISENFTVSAYHFDDTDEWRFDLRPKNKDAMFELLRVHFYKKDLRDMYLEDSLGQTTRIEFKTKQKNQPIDAQTFELDLDDSVDVIEEG
ncbi:outer membrane lipoprotein chaperone LolA [Ketobacter sp. MCCC 1A13808]|uniref:outer membrane lipoprotein chaperone LolA n=1 Tax=Ketobacter sp. MCCC 1A13808 TaxID=2602738 RepID=UPI000F29EFBC|nr:outer membrane lipoprotein chaperone LolA [Ketobacter sp. MCCC 1A13808]MVF10584.1 outer membrane lipoprotein chaperone LolA [Ketobacter sp. MCCC 1A13808]RLP56010.1 MAG: outer membrane lipoprotein carrier protein LolA [Ketobacter sp.]